MRRSTTLLTALVIASAAWTITEASRWSGASGNLRDAESRLEQVTADAETVVRLRASRQTVAMTVRPREDVLGLVNTVLADAGVPSNRLRDVAPESVRSEPAGDGGYRRQGMALTLSPLEPFELGRFLKTWQDTDTVWRVNGVELQHAAGQDTDPSYAVRVRLVANYVAEEAP